MSKHAPCTIRIAAVADLPAVIAHLVRFETPWREGRDPLPYGPYHRTDCPTIEERTARHLDVWSRPLTAAGWSRMLLGIVDDAIVGHVNLTGDGMYAGLHRARIGLGVEEAFRGRGLARVLMEAAIDRARAEPSIDWLELGVFVGNMHARALYERLGFRTTGIIPDRFRVDNLSIDDEWMVLKVS